MSPLLLAHCRQGFRTRLRLHSSRSGSSGSSTATPAPSCSARRTLVFFIHRSRRAYPKPSSPPPSSSPNCEPFSRDRATIFSNRRGSYKIPHFYPWNATKNGDGKGLEWRLKWGSSASQPPKDDGFSKSSKGNPDEYINEILDRVARSKAPYMHQLGRLEGQFNHMYRWAHGWSDAAIKEANALNSAILKQFSKLQMGKQEQAQVKRQRQPNTKPSYQANSTAAATHDHNQETEIDYISLKRVPKQKPGVQNPTDVARTTLMDALLTGIPPNTGSLNSSKATAEELELKSTALGQDAASAAAVQDKICTSESASEVTQDAVIHIQPSADTVIPLDSPKAVAQSVVDSSVAIVETSSEKAKFNATELEEPDLQAPLPNSSTLTASVRSPLEVNAAEMNTEINYQALDVSSTGKGEQVSDSVIEHAPELPGPQTTLAQETLAEQLSSQSPETHSTSLPSSGQYEVPKLSPADLIASLRYYDRNRGRLPDEEPLSVDDIAILESARDKLAKVSETRSKTDTDDKQEPSSKSRAKQAGIVIGSAVALTYIVGVGNKLVAQQSESTAAAELLSAVKRSRETKTG